MLSERDYLRAMANRIRAVAHNCFDLAAAERLRLIAEDIEERTEDTSERRIREDRA